MATMMDCAARQLITVIFLGGIIPPEGVMIIFHICLYNFSGKDSSISTKKSSHILTIVVASS